MSDMLAVLLIVVWSVVLICVWARWIWTTEKTYLIPVSLMACASLAGLGDLAILYLLLEV